MLKKNILILIIAIVIISSESKAQLPFLDQLSTLRPNPTLKTKVLDATPTIYQYVEQTWDSNTGSFRSNYSQTITYSSDDDTMLFTEYRFELGEWLDNDFKYRISYSDEYISHIEFIEEDWTASCEFTVEESIYSEIRCSDSDGFEYVTTVTKRENDYLLTSIEDGEVLGYISMVPNADSNNLTLYYFDANDVRTEAIVYGSTSINEIILQDILELDAIYALPSPYISYEYRGGEYIKTGEAGYIAGDHYDYEYWVYAENQNGVIEAEKIIYVDLDENRYATSMTTKYTDSQYPSSKVSNYLNYSTNPIDISSGPSTIALGSNIPTKLQPVSINSTKELELKEVVSQSYNSAKSIYENNYKRIYANTNESYDSGVFQEVTVTDYAYLFGDWAIDEFEETFRYQNDQFVFYRLKEENYLIECDINYSLGQNYESIVCLDNEQFTESLDFTYRTNDILITEKSNGEVDSYNQVIYDENIQQITFISYDDNFSPIYGFVAKGLTIEDIVLYTYFDINHYSALDYSMVEYYHNGQNWYLAGEHQWILTEENDYELNSYYVVDGLIKRYSVQQLSLDNNNYPSSLTEFSITEEDALGRYLFQFGEVSVNSETDYDSNQENLSIQLSQNYPNPFNPSTQIQYALPEATHVTLEVFNSLGQKVMELVNGQKSAGYHTATFDASGLSRGVYLYKLTTPSFTQSKKMLLIK